MRYLRMICLLFLTGCGVSQTIPRYDMAIDNLRNPPRPSQEAKLNSSPNMQSTPLEFGFGGIRFSIAIDDYGNVTVLNYPEEYEARVFLIRFDGQTGEEVPFSSGHCDKIKNIASQGYGGALIRNGYHTLLSFEMPAFLSDGLIRAVIEASKRQGLAFSSLYINNPPDKIRSSIKLSLDEKAISKQLGNIEALREQLHLGQRGMEKTPFAKEVNVYSADIICDLISGAAKITMSYPINGENRTLKVIYKPIEVKPLSS
jgi:hypothetical protein